jgi:hypothetical protein
MFAFIGIASEFPFPCKSNRIDVRKGKRIKDYDQDLI